MEARGKPQDRSSTKFNSAESAPHFGAFPSSIAVCNPPLRQPERRMLSGWGTSRVSGGRTNNLVWSKTLGEVPPVLGMTEWQARNFVAQRTNLGDSAAPASSQLRFWLRGAIGITV